MTEVDCTPGAHSFLDALAVVSFTLACGCRIRNCRIEDASEAVIQLRVGNEYPCPRHDDQVITRSTQKLVGWKSPPAWRQSQ